jgi:hypothetical protein
MKLSKLSTVRDLAAKRYEIKMMVDFFQLYEPECLLRSNDGNEAKDLVPYVDKDWLRGAIKARLQEQLADIEVRLTEYGVEVTA